MEKLDIPAFVRRAGRKETGTLEEKMQSREALYNTFENSAGSDRQLTMMYVFKMLMNLDKSSALYNKMNAYHKGHILHNLTNRIMGGQNDNLRPCGIKVES